MGFFLRLITLGLYQPISAKNCNNFREKTELTLKTLQKAV